MSDDVDINKKPSDLYEAGLIIGTLKYLLKNNNYLKFCNVVRNEISKFDKYAWDAGFNYALYEEETDIKNNYEDVQEEKRKLRLIHALRNSTDDMVLKISHKIPTEMTIETFAEYIAKAYRIVSKEIHNLSYSVCFEGQYCRKLISNKKINECIHLIMEDIEFNMGEMKLELKKVKTEETLSSQSDANY